MKSSKWFGGVALASVLMLSACGGGGGSAGTSFTSTDGEVTAADLSISASSTQLANTSNSKVTVTVTAVDAQRRIVPSAPVTISIPNSSGEYLGPTSTTTNEQGQITADVFVGENKANRDIQVKATSGSIAKSVQIRVVGVAISSTLSPALVEPAQVGKITYRVVDQANVALSKQRVQISAAGLTSTTNSGETDTNGEFIYTYTAPQTQGKYTVSASIAGVVDTQTVSVQPLTNEADPVQEPILTVAISANPTVVSPNIAGSETNRSRIRVRFATTDSRPLKDVRVKFILEDPNQIGGRLTNQELTRPLLSDSAGIVEASYIPGTRSSATEGVQIRACYGSIDAEAQACTLSKIVKLTVAQDALSVSIGTDENVVVGDLIYRKRYLVSVVDSAGVAKPDVNLSAFLDLPNYYKGFYDVVGDKWRPVVHYICGSEDLDRSGLLTESKDKDSDNILDPRPSDVQIAFENPISSEKPREAITRADGTAVLVITYAKSFASWVDADITVSASGVSGSEGRYTYPQRPVPIVASAVSNTDAAPAFVVSPYGTVEDCTDKR